MLGNPTTTPTRPTTATSLPSTPTQTTGGISQPTITSVGTTISTTPTGGTSTATTGPTTSTTVSVTPTTTSGGPSSPTYYILENYQALLWSIFQIGKYLREMATLSFIVKGARIYNPIHPANVLHVCTCYSKTNA